MDRLNPNTELVDWATLDDELARHIPAGCWLLAIRGDGKVYTGHAIEVTLEEVTLASGNQRQILQYQKYRYQVAKIRGPEPWTPKTASKRLL